LISFDDDDDAAAAVDREISSELSNEDCLLGDEEVAFALLSGLLPFIYHEREEIETMMMARDDEDGLMDDSRGKIYLQQRVSSGGVGSNT